MLSAAGGQRTADGNDTSVLTLVFKSLGCIRAVFKLIKSSSGLVEAWRESRG